MLLTLPDATQQQTVLGFSGCFFPCNLNTVKLLETLESIRAVRKAVDVCTKKGNEDH